jgi:hypothetical protein
MHYEIDNQGNLIYARFNNVLSDLYNKLKYGIIEYILVKYYHE